MAQKRKSSDAGSASKSKRSRDVLSMSEKVKIVHMIKNNVCGVCQVVWHERIFHSWSDEEQKKKFVLVLLLHRKLQKLLL